ncbi:MAG: organomercurial lyase, partial [Streptosporangiaceae bacterium]
ASPASRTCAGWRAARPGSTRSAPVNSLTRPMILARRMAALFARTQTCQDLACTWRHVLRMLSDGQSVSVEDIAMTTGHSAASLRRTLRRNPMVEWSAEGRLIGLGLTLRPTHQHLKVTGHDLYASSALDPLLLTQVLGKPVRVTTTCRATGTKIRLDVAPANVLEADPPTVAMSVPSHPEAAGHSVPSLPTHVSFFRSAQAASAWQRDHPGYESLAASDALSFAGHLNALLAACR